MNIQEKIKELGLVPLFPDYYYFNSSKKNPNDSLKIKSDDFDFRQSMRFERPLIDKMLYVSMEIINSNFDTEMHFVIDKFEGGSEKIYREDFRWRYRKGRDAIQWNFHLRARPRWIYAKERK